jgi:hypothetical protein
MFIGVYLRSSAQNQMYAARRNGPPPALVADQIFPQPIHLTSMNGDKH